MASTSSERPLAENAEVVEPGEAPAEKHFLPDIGSYRLWEVFRELDRRGVSYSVLMGREELEELVVKAREAAGGAPVPGLVKPTPQERKRRPRVEDPVTAGPELAARRERRAKFLRQVSCLDNQPLHEGARSEERLNS